MNNLCFKPDIAVLILACNHKKSRLIIVILIVILLLIQLIRIDTTNPETNPSKDFLAIKKTTEEIGSILKNSCSDCHSNQTIYPWYSKVAPASWWLKNHILEGREYLNFSLWGDYSVKKQNSLLEECAKEIEENKMPLKSYLLIHSTARLSTDLKQNLMDLMNHSE